MRCTKQQVEMFKFISIVTFICMDRLGVLVVNRVNMDHHTVKKKGQFDGSRRSCDCSTFKGTCRGSLANFDKSWFSSRDTIQKHPRAQLGFVNVQSSKCSPLFNEYCLLFFGWTTLSGTYLEQQNSKGSKEMVRDRKYTPLVACSLLDKERNTAWFHVHAL